MLPETRANPRVAGVPYRYTRILWRIVHKGLYHFSKWTSVEEVISMQIARAADVPFSRRVPILMTRLPGIALENSKNSEDIVQPEKQYEPWLEELKICVSGAVCSPLGSQIKSSQDFHRYLLGPASAHAFKSKVEYEATVSRPKKLHKGHHRIAFTHGDLKAAHNILESEGLYPEYWEFITAMRFGRDGWWFQLDSDRAVTDLTVDSYIAF
ncbi:hypothetical protein BJX66DRAFT_331166 [Aspergillus keveii]|uniref:Uncharacterized protein n=1 Tax=Aspergillus keveii TaxID=714993 RepID=A0ABR4FGU7_9EURO